MADLYTLKGDLSNAVAVYEDILKLDIKNPLINFNLGVIYSRLNRLDEALVEFDKVIKSNPDYVEAYMAMAILYEIKGEKDSAIGQCW